MTKFVRLAALAAAATIIATPAAAQVSAGTPATATARIVKPLTLTADVNLDFGSVIVWDAGTITIDDAGAITCTADLQCDLNGTAAEFTVTGTNGHTVQVTTSNSTLDNQGPGTGSLTFDPADVADVPLNNSGRAGVQFNVGGQIAIPQNAEPGTYVGDMDVTVEY